MRLALIKTRNLLFDERFKVPGMLIALLDMQLYIGSARNFPGILSNIQSVRIMFEISNKQTTLSQNRNFFLYKFTIVFDKNPLA